MHLIVRYFDQLNGWQRINGGEAAEYPFWSPDGKQLAFFADGKLLRVDPPTACRSSSVRWWKAGVASGSRMGRSCLRFVLRSAHARRRIRWSRGRGVGPGRGRQDPCVSRHGGTGRLLYLAGHAKSADRNFDPITLDAPQRATTVMKTARSGVYDRGYLFYDRNGYIVGQRFDPSTNRFQGEPVRVTRGVEQPSGRLGYLPLAAAGGHVVVATIPQSAMQLVWRTRRGDPAGRSWWRVRPAESPDLSPDGKRLAIARRLPANPTRTSGSWTPCRGAAAS